MVSRGWALLFFWLLCFSNRAPAPIVQEAAERDYDLIVRERRRIQQSTTPDEIRRKAEEDIERQNREVLAKMQRPPIDFPHFIHPPDPRARESIRVFLQRSTAERAGVPQVLSKKRGHGFGWVVWASALLVLCGVGMHWYFNRAAEQR